MKEELYLVLHPKDEMNTSCDLNAINYNVVGHVHACSPTGAFNRAQSFNIQYEQLGIRSTSVGDVLVHCPDEYDISTYKYYMVKPFGFSELPANWWLTHVNDNMQEASRLSEGSPDQEAL